MSCIIVGDSIGVGVAEIRKDCTSYVKSGINSHDWNKRYYNKQLFASTVVISLGSNDYKGIRTREELEYLRHSVVADRVLWILPAAKENIRDIIMMIADNFGDDILEIRDVSPDGVHPTPRGYRGIAKQF